MSVVEELKMMLGEHAVLDPRELRLRARNYWDSSPLEALALIRPQSTDEVSRAMTCCYSHGQTVVVHGGLTGVCDGDRATSKDVVISLELMTAIEDIDTVGRTVTVQAGCKLQALQEAVRREGLYFPLDLGARGSCTLGGNVSTNAGGTNVIRYGMMRALVLGLEVVLPDGTVVSSMNHMLKNNTGYDVKQLFIGSEGTLGIVTRMVLCLREPSSSVNTVLVALRDGENLFRLLKHMDSKLGGTLTSFEAMWGDYYRAVTAPGFHDAPLDRDYPYYVIVEAQGSQQAEDSSRFDAAMEEALKEGLIDDAIVPKSGTERDKVWEIREDFEALFEKTPLFLYDVSVPLRHMHRYVEEVGEGLKRAWAQGMLYILGHVGDGNIHFFVWPGEPDDPLVQHKLADKIVYSPLRRIGGAVSAEHGIGLEKKEWINYSRSAAEIKLMRMLKRAIDPNGILNAGKIIDQ